MIYNDRDLALARSMTVAANEHLAHPDLARGIVRLIKRIVRK
ncbi:hypothetical protein [Bifidobacterium avesanii]|nr:hypothetical protein [Bifidobacterium avesanii]KAB8291930.1 hypothetical protein DSM100685_1114 [Bifidobacterium avesanii]